MVDYIKLIKLVERRRPLWDDKHIYYHNRGHARKLWVEIAEQLGCTDTMAKQKWRGLRDVFRKETHKLNSPDVSGETQPKWRFYDHLLFLSKDTPENHDVKPPECVEVKVEVDEDFDTQSSVEKAETADYDTDDFRLESRMDEYHGDPLNVESTTDRSFDRKQPRLDHAYASSMAIDAEGDYYFLMSLLPHLRDVPMKRKLAVRQALQSVLLNEECATDNFSNYKK